MPDDTPSPEEVRRARIDDRRRRGKLFLLVGSLFALGAVNVAKTASSGAEALGAYSVPLVCWLIGAYYYSTDPR